jgi:sigma-B regulation protein RsbU (phosphoserine phosphatase)
MKPDHAKSQDELIEELNRLRQEAPKEKEVPKLPNERKRATDKNNTGKDQTAETLRVAQLIIDKSPAVLLQRTTGPNPRMVDVSDNICQFGYRPEEFLGGRLKFKDIVHPDDYDRVQEEIRDYVQKDVEEYTQVYRILTKNAEIRWVEDQTSVVRDAGGRQMGSHGIVVDFTKRIQAEEQLHKSEEKYRRIVETAGEGFILMDQDLKITDVNAAFCRMLGYSRAELLGKTPLDLAAKSLEQFMAANRKRLLALEYRKFEGDLLAKNGRHVPVLINGNTLRDKKGRIVGHMAFMADMTVQKKTLALAGEVQKGLLPHSKPQIPGLDVAGKNVSCQEIGGDYFDFLSRQDCPNAYFSVVVGDVTGHGVDAALLMATARAFLCMCAAQSGTLSQIITEMNGHLAHDVLDTSRFMTLFYLALDPEEESVRWVRAGHDPALLYDPSRDKFEELEGRGMALGVDEKFAYEENCKTGLAQGQIIAIGTDGIWEAHNKDGEMFGKERFRNIIRENAYADADGILNAVYDGLSRFSMGVKSEDDITLVVIKIINRHQKLKNLD